MYILYTKTLPIRLICWYIIIFVSTHPNNLIIILNHVSVLMQLMLMVVGRRIDTYIKCCIVAIFQYLPFHPTKQREHSENCFVENEAKLWFLVIASSSGLCSTFWVLQRRRSAEDEFLS